MDKKLKKRCKYCRNLVKIKEKEIKSIKDNGRGVLCDLCGDFIEVPKKPSYINKTVNSYRAMGYYMKKRRRNNSIYIIIAIIFSFIIITYTLIILESQPFYLTEEKENSTFQFLDEYTGYDISSELNISILAPKYGVSFDENKDIYNKSNFKEIIHMRVSLIQIDVRYFDYVWIFTDPMNTSNYRSNYYLVNGGINYNYIFKIKLEEIYYHLYNFSDTML